MKAKQKILGMGAEAIIKKSNNVVEKERISKTYRVKELDVVLRKERTKREAKIMEKLIKAGVKIPNLIKVEDFSIFMEFINGKALVEVACKNKKIFKKLGFYVGKMHNLGIYHGDLTTSNAILKGEEVYLIDFGLGGFSKKIEDFAVDLHVFKQSLESKHYKCMKEIWNYFIKGYSESFPDYKKVLTRLEEVEKRGRYKRKKK